MNKTGKIIRIVAIILLGMTAAMNLLGGIGTSCAAFSNNVGYRLAFKELLDYRWLYQALVVTTVLIGLAGIWGLVKLVRGGPKVYRDALIILVIGCALGGVHYFASMALRGKATPANVKFYINILTLIVFLIFLVPGIRDKVNFTSAGGKNETSSAAGIAAIMAGALTLTVFNWAGPSHTFFQENWTYVFYAPLVAVGTALALWGSSLIGRVVLDILSQEVRIPELIAPPSHFTTPFTTYGRGLGWGSKIMNNPMKIKFGVNHVIGSISGSKTGLKDDARTPK